VSGRDGRVASARVSRFGEETWLVEFDGGLDPAVNDQVIALAAAIEARQLPGVAEVVPAAASLAVQADPELFDQAGLEETIAAVARTSRPVTPGSLHQLPVCYEPPFALDLDTVAAACGCTPADVVQRHLAVEYRVFMLGFLPGFPYLGLLDERIAVPRRQAPRVAVPAGSVGIAGRQTGVYPMESPGGWHIIGRTPLPLFDPAGKPPARLGPGDRVRFVPIDRRDYGRLRDMGWRREP
jgi:inhibitor of KinA